MTFKPEKIVYHGVPELDEGFLLKPSSGTGLSLQSTKFVDALALAFEARAALHERVGTIPGSIENPNERAERYQPELVAYIKACEAVNSLSGSKPACSWTGGTIVACERLDRRRLGAAGRFVGGAVVLLRVA